MSIPLPSRSTDHQDFRSPRSRHRLRQLSLACLASLPLGAATADHPALLSEEDLYGGMPVVLSVTRLSQPAARAPAATTIIDRQMIEASGARSIPDLFRLVPGFVVTFERGHRGVVAYHGLTGVYSRRLQVLVDGRSVYLPSFGGLYWSDLALSIEDIERIEVVRGPNTAAYGANAFQGIINIQTRHAGEADGAHVEVRAGNSDIRDAVLRFGDTNERAAWRVTAAQQHDSGFAAQPDDSRTRHVTSRIDLRPTPNDHVLLHVGALTGTRGEGIIDDGENPPREREVWSHSLQARWQRKLGVDHDVQVQFFHQYHEQDERYAQLVDATAYGFGVISVPLREDARSRRYDLEAQHRFRPSRDTRLVWGANVRRDVVSSDTYLPEDAHFELARTFANLEWALTDRLSANAGAMLEDNSFTGSDFSPRLALNYALTPAHVLRAAFSEAIRVPSAVEERADARVCINPPACNQIAIVLAGSRSLEPEQIVAREIGYQGRFGERVTVDLKLYRNTLSNLIDQRDFADTVALSGGTATVDLRNEIDNRHSARLNGFEAQLDWRLGRNDRAFVSYAHTNVRSDHSRLEESMPEQAASLLYMHRFPAGLHGSMGYYYYSSFRPLDGDPMPQVRRLDVRLAKDFRVDGSAVRLAFVAQNLLDDYIEHLNENVFDTRAYVSLELSF